METREQMLVSVAGVQVLIGGEAAMGTTPSGLELKGRWSLVAIFPFLWVVLIKTKSRVKKLVRPPGPAIPVGINQGM